jgi:hypothetical protein
VEPWPETSKTVGRITFLAILPCRHHFSPAFLGYSWFMISKHLLAAAILLLLTNLATPASAQTSVGETARLIRQAEKGVADPQGWAIDLLDVLRLHSLDQGKENTCAAIAVIDQESGFVADPAVPGLGKLSEQALREKLGKVPVAGAIVLRWLENNPSPQASFMARIRLARTERDLDFAYRALVEHAGEKSGLGTVAQLGLLNNLIEERNEIDTAGSMQVSVKFALDMARQRRWLPMMLEDVYAVRDDLFTRRGGMYYGIAQLLGYETGYPRKIFRFADYNAGRYASRNAAVQMIAAKLSGNALALDGDLLSYGKSGNLLTTVTSTERAIRKALTKSNPELTSKQIRTDLAQEKDKSFVSTRTYLTLREAYAKSAGKPAPFAVLPQIELKSPKIRRMMTTRIFAESVDRRYQACIARK